MTQASHSKLCETPHQLEQHLRRVNTTNVNSGLSHTIVRQKECRAIFELCEKLGVECAVAIYGKDEE